MHFLLNPCRFPTPCLNLNQFTQRIILKYIEAEHKDPANGEELCPDDLIPVKASTSKPRGKRGSGPIGEVH